MRLWIKLGVLTVVGLSTLVWIAVQVGRLSGPASPFRPTYALAAEFNDATGLYGGDEVRLAGVRVGTVDGVTVEDGRAVVSMSIAEARSIPEGSRFELRWRSVLGQRFVQIVPPADASPDGPSLAEGTRVGADSTGDAADLSALLADLEPLLGSLDTGAMNRVMHTLAGAMDGREQQIGDAITSSAELLEQLNARADSLGSTVEQMATVLDGLAAKDQEAADLLTALADASGALATQSGDIGTAIAETGEFVGVLDETLAANEPDLAVVLDQLRQITGTVAEREVDLSEGLRTLAWSSAALLRTTSHGDWMQIYGRGFGLINTFTPEPRVGPDYSDVGPDDPTAPDPIGGQPSVPAPELPEIPLGPITINPEGDPTATPSLPVPSPTPSVSPSVSSQRDAPGLPLSAGERSSGLELLFLALRGER